MKSILSKVLLASSFGCVVASCSDASESEPQSGVGGSMANTGGSSNGGSSGASKGGTSNGGTPTGDYGEVYVQWASGGFRMYPGGISAKFLRESDRSVCKERVVGDCRSFICTPSGSPALPNAGTITLVNNRSAFTFDLEPWSQGAYSDKALIDASFAAGDSLTVRSNGGPDVAAFDISLAFPHQVLVESPTQLSAGQDIRLTWRGGKAGEVMAFVNGGVTCSTSADKNELTIPAEMTSVNARFEAVVDSRAIQSVGSWSIYVNVLTTALSSEGKDYSLRLVE